MKPFTLCLALAAAAAAQAPYHATSGPVTIAILDWTNHAAIPGLPDPPVPLARGLFITACTTDPATANLRLVVGLRTGTVQQFWFASPLLDMRWARCTSTVISPLDRAAVAFVSVEEHTVARRADFPLESEQPMAPASQRAPQ